MTRKFQDQSPDPDSLTPHEDRPYRAGVGIVLINKQGMVFVGERVEHPDSWQMPQGGIDDGEDAEVAVFREMMEEIGTRNARILGVMKEWMFYDIPVHTANKLWGAKYRGQKQRWIALEFLGEDHEIRLDADDHPEFQRWKWVSLDELLDYVVPFKRDVYARVMEEFAEYVDDVISAHKK